MKNFPIFPSEHGVASLTLQEIPYQGKAYITIQSATEPKALLDESVAFCKMCGAKAIFASGHPILEENPLHTAVWEYCASKADLPEVEAFLWPVVPENLMDWREIYNQKVVKVPTGVWMTEEEGLKMCREGGGYYVHSYGELLGTGKLKRNCIEWVASMVPGAGETVLCALAHATSEETTTLSVASANKKAVKLYERLGFLRTREITRWYEINF